MTAGPGPAFFSSLSARGDRGSGVQQQHLPDVFRPTLCNGVKYPHGVDLVVEELTPHRLIHQGGKHVQNAAPEGKLAHTLHLAAADIPGGRQAVRQISQVCSVPCPQCEGKAL